MVKALPVEDILKVARSHGALEVRVFGSFARGEADGHSDLDLLVTIRPGTGLWDLIGIANDLEDLLGIKVEVTTENGLHPRLRDQILSEARSLVA